MATAQHRLAHTMLKLRTNDFRHILPDLVKCVQESGVMPRLVRIEGVMRVGKTPLADMLAGVLGAKVIHVEREFAYQEKLDRPYAEAIDIGAFHARLTSRLQEPTWTIVEAVCLDEVAPEHQFGRGFVIYVKQVAVLGPDLYLWHGFDEYSSVPDHPLHRSVHSYHERFRPHEKADVLIVLPEEGHSFSDSLPR
jgi:hypothetical protein